MEPSTLGGSTLANEESEVAYTILPPELAERMGLKYSDYRFTCWLFRIGSTAPLFIPCIKGGSYHRLTCVPAGEKEWIHLS